MPLAVDCDKRQALHKALGVEEALAQRTVIKLKQSGVHCEAFGLENPTPKGVLVFLPGIGTYVELYALMLLQAAKQGYWVIGVDYPGHGFSEGKRGAFVVEDVTTSVTELLDTLGRSDLPVGVWGYSIGSLLGLAVAESDHRVSALLCGTLILPDVPPDPSYSMGWWVTHQQAFWFPSLNIPLRMFIDLDKLLAAHPASHMISQDELIVYDYPLKTLSSLFGYHSKVAKAPQAFKSAILHGQHDEVLPLGYSRRLVNQLPHPFELIALPQTGHMAPWLSMDDYMQAAISWFDGAFQG